MKKFILIFPWILIIIIIAIFLFCKSKYYPEYCSLKQKSEKHDILLERDNRIRFMEKTLIIHYKLSWYEAHYYSIIFDDFSCKYNIPWQIYPAMIRVESNFNSTVKSDKGAKGLTQVMESTAKEIAGKLNIPYDIRTLWNEILNLAIGLTYLSEGIKELGLEDGINRYIGGPGFNKGRKDIGDYRTTIRWEYDRLTYIHQGVLNSPMDDTTKTNDSLKVK